MSIEEQHIALPRLYGAPAYARPPRHGDDGEKPFDPDELPIESLRTDEEHEFVSTLPAQAFAPGGIYLASDADEAPTDTGLQPRAFSLRGIAGRLRGS